MDAQHGTGLELILNAAEGVLQIVVTEDEHILCAQEWYRSERATEILAPALAELATSLGIRWSDLRRMACVRGPGSFTGIRLTLATAAALRRCGRAQLAGLDYMQALATTAVMQRGMLYGGHIWVLTHARRNLVHCQPFVSYGPEIPAQPLQGVHRDTPCRGGGGHHGRYGGRRSGLRYGPAAQRGRLRAPGIPVRRDLSARLHPCLHRGPVPAGASR